MTGTRFAKVTLDAPTVIGAINGALDYSLQGDQISVQIPHYTDPQQDDVLTLYVNSLEVAQKTIDVPLELNFFIRFNKTSLNAGNNIITYTISDTNGNTGSSAPAVINVIHSVPEAKSFNLQITPGLNGSTADGSATNTAIAILTDQNGAPVCDLLNVTLSSMSATFTDSKTHTTQVRTDPMTGHATVYFVDSNSSGESLTVTASLASSPTLTAYTTSYFSAKIQPPPAPPINNPTTLTVTKLTAAARVQPYCFPTLIDGANHVLITASQNGRPIPNFQVYCYLRIYGTIAYPRIVSVNGINTLATEIYAQTDGNGQIMLRIAEWRYGNNPYGDIHLYTSLENGQPPIDTVLNYYL